MLRKKFKGIMRKREFTEWHVRHRILALLAGIVKAHGMQDSAWSTETWAPVNNVRIAVFACLKVLYLEC